MFASARCSLGDLHLDSKIEMFHDNDVNVDEMYI